MGFSYDNDAKNYGVQSAKSREQLKALGIENLTLHLLRRPVLQARTQVR